MTPLSHKWKNLHPLLNQDALAPCNMAASHECRRCRLKICQLTDPCSYCGKAIRQECQPVRKLAGRPPKPPDPSKPRRRASQEKAADGIQLLSSLIPCAFCNRGIFEGDVYCRHCGHPQKQNGAVERASKAKSIYLARDLGLPEREKETLLSPVITALQRLGLEVRGSVDRSELAKPPKPGWAYQLGQQDFTYIAQADAVFVIVRGYPADEGVMVDLGIATALGKPTFLFRDDTRRTVGDEEYPLNLKLFAGMPRDDWRDHYYTSIEEIAAPGKALARWARQ